MRTAAEDAPDLRAFFDRALGDPGDGGIYYAARVLADCVSLATARNAPHAKQVRSGTEDQLARSVAALDQAVARCDGLGDDASKAALAAALNASVALDDPFEGMILRERAARATDGKITFDAASAMVQQAIGLGDPNFFVESLRRLDGVANGFDELELQAHDLNGFRGLLDIVAIEARCALGVDCAREVAAIRLCYQGECGPYVERLGIQANFTDDEKRFIVQAAADVAAAARDGTLLGRYRR